MYGPESVGSLRSDEIPLGANVRSAENYTVEPFDRSWPDRDGWLVRLISTPSRHLPFPRAQSLISGQSRGLRATFRPAIPPPSGRLKDYRAPRPMCTPTG